MANFLTCRSSCCDYNVLRQCSYILSPSYSLASPVKEYRCSERLLCNSTKQVNYSTASAIRQFGMGSQALKNWSWTATSFITKKSSKSRTKIDFLLPSRHRNSILLNSPIPCVCSYHSCSCNITYSLCCKSRHVHPVPVISTTVCCYCLLHKPQRQSPPVFRCFSVGKKHSHTHYYDVLGLTSKASQKQIKTAYYDLSKKHHPDVTNNKKSHILFTEISEAYEVLGNIQKRRMYDKGMFSHRDQRVYDEDDYTQSYKKKTTQSPYERGNRPPPPTGRSKIYNFDEFYKQHYNDMRERRKQEYDAFQHYKKMNDFNYEGRRQNIMISSPVLMSVCLTLLVIVIIVNEYLYDQDLVREEEKGRNR